MMMLKCLMAICMVFTLIGCAGGAGGGQVLPCSFARGKWNPRGWTRVKSPRWDHFGGWVQRDTHIENETPAGATADEMLGARAGETFSSMVLSRKVSGDLTISSTMDFAHRMAPLIVIAHDLGADAAGRAEYREHYEIVIYDQGVNLWHHYFRDGKPSWVKAAHAEFTLAANVQYELKVRITQVAKGKLMSISVAGHDLEHLDDSLPDEFYAGITGIEGVNRFYDFDVRAVLTAGR